MTLSDLQGKESRSNVLRFRVRDLTDWQFIRKHDTILSFYDVPAIVLAYEKKAGVHSILQPILQKEVPINHKNQSIRGRQIISCGFQARDFVTEQGTKNEHSHSSASDEQRSAVAKDQHSNWKVII